MFPKFSPALHPRYIGNEKNKGLLYPFGVLGFSVCFSGCLFQCFASRVRYVTGRKLIRYARKQRFLTLSIPSRQFLRTVNHTPRFLIQSLRESRMLQVFEVSAPRALMDTAIRAGAMTGKTGSTMPIGGTICGPFRDRTESLTGNILFTSKDRQSYV